MRVLLAGATGAIGWPLIRGLKQHGHSVFGLVRSAESTRMLTEMGAEAVIGDALDAASFGNDAWPAKYLFDDRGCLVRRWVGEGSYDEIEREIRRLVAAAHSETQLPAVTELTSTFSKAGQSSYAGITNETYIGA
jgi:nucleoside-diphosphate-sugar epimerase